MNLRDYRVVSVLGCVWMLGWSPARGAEWKLVWEDDFERAEIGEGWQVGENASIEEGKMRLEGVMQAVIERPFAPDVRLEFEARSLPGVPPCDLSATLACGKDLQWGYLLGFGARGNRANHLMGPGVSWADEDPPFVIEREKLYHLVAQKEGKRITYTVNGTTIIDQEVEDPVGGSNFDRVGVLTWTGMTVDNVKVYERTPPHPDSPAVLDRLPDAPLYRDGRKLRIRNGQNTPELRKAVDTFNTGDLDGALKLFQSLGSSLMGLLGQAYVYGDLQFREPVYHDHFVELATAFTKASEAEPDNKVLADYALATQWFSGLAMSRKGSGSVSVIRLMALGPKNNPFFYKARLYRVRYQFWGGAEGGAPHIMQDARNQAKELMELWPENIILRQYTGERIPWGEEYLADTEKHPAWAAYLREAYARDVAIMERFLRERQREDGQMGGGYGDDVEMMRSWMMIAAISSAAEEARAGIEKLAQGVWDNVLLNGYDRALTDVEHSSEASADTLPGMLLLRHGDPLWVERNLQSCHTIKTCFMGLDNDGYPRFKSASIGRMEIGDPILGGGDVGYHARPMKHFLWAAWQGNLEARDWFVRWTDGWRVATITEIDGKIAGFPPLTLWYPTSSITPPVEGKTWYDEKMNHWAHQPMTQDTFLASYWLTRDPKFLEPFNMAMQLASKGPLPKGDHDRGTREWQMASIAHFPNNMGTEQSKVGLYLWLTGDKAYEEYTWHTAPPALKFRMDGNLERYLRSIEGAATATRTNIEMMTSEVMAMDRAGLPSALSVFGAYTGAISTMRDAATPTFAVTYDTPSTDFASLVMHASEERLRLWMYNFEDKPMTIGLKLWRLRPGTYILEQGEQMPSHLEGQFRYGWGEPRDVKIIHHGFGPVIKVPPGKVWAVDLRLKEPIELPEEAPDLAIHARDVRVEGDEVVVTVHNIGSGDAGAFSLTVFASDRSASSSSEKATVQLDGLAAPRSFEASVKEVRVQLPGVSKDSKLAVMIEPVAGAYDRNMVNNACLRLSAPE